jgi:hypothetical protein
VAGGGDNVAPNLDDCSREVTLMYEHDDDQDDSYVCDACNGSGDCSDCEGTGWADVDCEVDCRICRGTAECVECFGSGGFE